MNRDEVDRMQDRMKKGLGSRGEQIFQRRISTKSRSFWNSNLWLLDL